MAAVEEYPSGSSCGPALAEGAVSHPTAGPLVRGGGRGSLGGQAAEALHKGALVRVCPPRAAELGGVCGRRGRRRGARSEMRAALPGAGRGGLLPVPGLTCVSRCK